MGYKGTTKWQGKFTVGDTFGEWTVTDANVIVEHEAKVKCKCTCGTERYVTALTLVRGISKRCSECVAYGGSNNGNWKGIGFVPGYYLNKRGLDKSARIEAAELIEKQEFKCKLTGLPISFTDNTASLDRIDSTKPYVKGNMQWVHKDVNVMKNGYNLDYFIKMCKLIAKYNKNMDVTEATSKFVFGNTTNHKR